MTRFKGILNNPQFIQALRDLPAFVYEMDADIDMAYDWVADQSEPFVADLDAWDLFYDCFCESHEDALL